MEAVEANKHEAHKVCKLCGTEKPIGEYYYRKDSDRYSAECKACRIERQRVRRIGVSNQDYEAMLIRQEGQCAICKSKLNSSRYTKFAVDHCHKTGKVRGLLCTNCNTAIGLMKDSVIRLQQAIDYLSVG